MFRSINPKVVLGTRGSELAKAQTLLAVEAMRQAKRTLRVETKIISTSGDESEPKPIERDFGRKGMFTAELEKALLAKEVDIAVHSAKDLPSELAAGTEIAAVLPRGAVEDVLVAMRAGGLKGLPHDAVVATGSVRRQHQLRWKRPDLDIVDLRGNVPTRLRKLAKGDWHAIILARAGLERLGLATESSSIQFEGSELFIDLLPLEVFLSAGGQGIIALQIRADDVSTREIVDLANHPFTLLCLQAERAFLRLLQGDCRSPVGVLATLKTGLMTLRAQVFEQDATFPRTGEVEGNMNERERLAADLFGKIGGSGSSRTM